MEENKNLNPEQNSGAESANASDANAAEASTSQGAGAQDTGANDANAAETIKQAAQGGAQKPKKDWKKEAREWVVSIAVALLVVFVIRNFLFQIIRVDGDSMNTTLLNNERLFVTVLDVRLNGAERGDVVICHYPNRGRTNFVKRVVAVEGDIVYREEGVTHVVYEAADADGNVQTVDEMLDERYAMYFPGGSSDDYAPYTLGENEYFVVGDNRYNSHDSRDWNDSDPSRDVGPITGDMLVGKVRQVIWPLSEIRPVA